MSAKYLQVRSGFEVWIICEALWEPRPEGRPAWCMLLLLYAGRYWKRVKSLLIYCVALYQGTVQKQKLTWSHLLCLQLCKATNEVEGLEIFVQVQIVTYFQSPYLYHVLSNLRFYFLQT